MWILQSIRHRVEKIQKILNYDGWNQYPHFTSDQGIGKIAFTSCILSFLFGIHFVYWCQLTIHNVWLYNNHHHVDDDTNPTTGGTTINEQLQQQIVQYYYNPMILWGWCTYVCSLCVFHLFEFYTTLLYNPTVLSYSSYLVNHSTAYTAAAILSWMEFMIRQILFYITIQIYKKYSYINDNNNNEHQQHHSSKFIIQYIQYIPFFYGCMIFIGFLLVCLGQCIRTMSMITAAESFNHLIQIEKKDTHLLIQHGIYQYIRHPSYCGFFLWCIGTQCLLGNIFNTLLYTISSWTFFYRRIAYEEESLCRLFPIEYPIYISTSYSGIPFIYTQVQYRDKMKKQQ